MTKDPHATPDRAAIRVCGQCGEHETAFCPYMDYEKAERPPRCINEHETPDD
jgi:hypothetical protein